MKRLACALAGVFLVLAESLSAQDIDARVTTLDASGRYAEALALCLRDAGTSPVAAYFVADYIYHGRRGVERDEDKGKACYRKAWQGVRLVERKETQAEGVALLREAAQGGSAVALARLAALCYLGEGGVEQNLEMAVKLLQEAVDSGFSEGIVPLEMLSGEHRHKAAQAKLAAARDSIRPGHGFPGRLAAYPVTPQLILI